MIIVLFYYATYNTFIPAPECDVQVCRAESHEEGSPGDGGPE